MIPEDSFWLFVWESVATAGIIAVIVGIFGEGSELLTKWAIKRKYKQFQKGLDTGARWFMAVLLKFIRPKLLEVETFAFALVVIGLVAEFWGGHKSQEILGRNNSQLNLQAKQLGATNAQLIADNLVLRSNFLALEMAVQWRTITPTDKTNLVLLLSPLAKSLPDDQKKIRIGVVGTDNPESKRFAIRLDEILVECGFDVELNFGTNVGTRDGEGLLFEVKSSAHSPPTIVPILKALRDINVQSVKGVPYPNMEENILQIWVLPKPER